MDHLKVVFGDNLMSYFEGIPFEDFVSLQPEQIKEAIPNVIHRIMFENKFKTFIATADNATVFATDKNLAGVQNDPICVIIDPNETGASTSSYNTQNDPIFDVNFESYNSVNKPLRASKTVLVSQKPTKKNTVIMTTQDIIDIPSISLKVVIMKCVENKKKMENHDRIVIGKAIIHHLLVGDFERMINRSEFINIAKLITQLFENELEGTYYTPSVKSTQAQGKLYSAYTNYRTQLIEVGLIGKKDSKTGDDDSDTEESEVAKVHLEEKSDALKLVLEETDDFEQIKVCWQMCFNERQKLLNEFSTFEYMRRFPSFDLPTGYELLKLDAETLFVDKNSLLLQIAPKIIAYAYPKKKKTLELKSLIAAYNELTVDLEDGSIQFQTVQQLMAIRLLPHLMQNPKKKTSKSEVERLFCPYFKTALAADSHNSDFNQLYKDNPLSLKPRLYFIGNLSNPCANIIIANKTYKIENSIIGFDIFFKSFLALKCDFPEETKHVWQFIQKVIYEIETQGSKNTASVETFVNDIKNFDI